MQLSDLSWTAVLARAEPCVENRSVQFFSVNRATPTVLSHSAHCLRLSNKLCAY